MTTNDKRSEEQKTTHVWAVIARDAFMSGWGGASGGHSRCAWAFDSVAKADWALGWVNRRSEMRNVRVADLRAYRVPGGTAHFTVYVPNEEHPSLEGFKEAQAYAASIN